LLREVEAPATVGVESIPLDRIEPNPFQPRREFSDESLQELADSLRAEGLVQPVILRPAGARYQLVVGERRWRAARLAGLEAIPALVRDISDREALEFALTENLLRADLNPLEVANGLQALQVQYGLTHEEIAARLGIKRSTVTNLLRLLRLPPEVQDMLREGEISGGHARALLGLKSAEAQIELARAATLKGLSVRQVEELVPIWEVEPVGGEEKPAEKLDPNVRAAVLEMERVLGTRVRIVGKPESGRIEIRYYSAEDLDRIFGWIVRR
jgi:ParB family chromosome partitioning protein